MGGLWLSHNRTTANMVIFTTNLPQKLDFYFSTLCFAMIFLKLLMACLLLYFTTKKGSHHDTISENFIDQHLL
jgi:hypothetical protein